MDSSETAVESQYNLLHYHHNNYQSHLPLYSLQQQAQQSQQQQQPLQMVPTEVSKDRRLLHRNVIIQNDANGDRVLAENIAMVVDGMDQVYFRVLIGTLRTKNLIEPNSSIFFFDVTRNIYVHQGCESTMPDSRIALSRIDADEIRIRFRPAERRFPLPQPQQIMSDFMVGNQASSLLARRNPMNCFPESNRLSNGHRQFSNTQGDSYYMSSQEHGAGQNIQFLSDMPCNSDEQSKIFGEEDDDFEGDNHVAAHNQQKQLQNDEDGTFGMMANESTSYSHPHQSMLSHSLPSQLQQTTTTTTQMAQSQQQSKQIPREKRVKERKIGYVHSRVMEWRTYYEVGVKNEQGKLQKVNLDMAAGLVGLSRKTLDDYYKYIRKAEDLNFDFKGRSEEKIGVLRNFVRDKSNRGTKQEDTTDSQQNSPEEAAAAESIGADDYFEEAAAAGHDQTFKQSKNSIISNNHQEITPVAAAAATAVIKVEENIKNSTEQPQHQIRDLLPPPPPYEHELEWIYRHYKSALSMRNLPQTTAAPQPAAAAAEDFVQKLMSSSMEIEPEQQLESQEFLSNRLNLLKKGTLHQQQNMYANNNNNHAITDSQNQQQYFAAYASSQDNLQQAEGEAYSPDEDFDYLNSDTEMRKNEQED